MRGHNDFRADLHVAPLGDALPAEEVSAGSRCGVSPLLQAEDTPRHSRARARCMLRTADTQGSPFTIKTVLQSLDYKFYLFIYFFKDTETLTCSVRFHADILCLRNNLSIQLT